MIDWRITERGFICSFPNWPLHELTLKKLQKFHIVNFSHDFLFSFQGIAVSCINISQFCIGLGLGFSATFVPYIKEKGFEDDKDDVPSSSEIGIIGWSPNHSLCGSAMTLIESFSWQFPSCPSVRFWVLYSPVRQALRLEGGTVLWFSNSSCA